MRIPVGPFLILAVIAAFVFFSPEPSPAECEPRVHIQLTTEFKGDSSEVPIELARLYLPDVSSGPQQISDTPLIYTSTPGALRVHTTWNYHSEINFLEITLELFANGESIISNSHGVDLNKEGFNQELEAVKLDLHAMAHILSDSLPISSAEIFMDRHVIEATSPENVTVYLDKLKGAVRDIPVEERSTFYCLGLRLRDQVRKTEEIEISEKETLSHAGQEFDMQGWSKSCNGVGEPCARPVAEPELRVISAFGDPNIFPEDKIKIEDTPKLTLRCPVRVKGGPVIALIPGEEKEVTFQAVDFKDEPLTLVEATGFELDPQSFGQLSHGKEDIIPTLGTEGVIRELMVRASPDARGMAEVVCRICEDTPEDLLGEDEDGQPLYYTEEEKIGIRRVSVLPEIEVFVLGEIDIQKDLSIVSERERSYQKTRETETGREKMELTFRARFIEREEALVNQPELGFTGSRISYIGKAKDVSLRLSSKKPRKQKRYINGWFEKSDCGRVSYAYTPNLQEHEIDILRPDTTLDVYYHHFIPDPESKIKVHPAEGLSFNNMQSGGATFSYKINIHTKQMKTDNSCGVTYSAMPMPQVEVPLHLDQYLFPVPLLTMISSGCYGLGREFELMNINKYGQMFRKLNKEGDEFDEFTMEKDFSLDPGTRADCWELDDAGLDYSGRTDVYMYIESRAEILRGGFDLTRQKSDADLRLEAETPDYLKHIIPDIPEPPSGGDRESGYLESIPSALQDDIPQALPDSESLPPEPDPGRKGGDEPALFMYDSDGNPISPEKFLENMNQ